MDSRIVAVRVASPGTMEQHITDFRTESGNSMSKEAMIMYLSMNRAYYTIANGVKARLEIARTANNEQYVRTVPDGTTANNLLSLPRF